MKTKEKENAPASKADYLIYAFLLGIVLASILTGMLIYNVFFNPILSKRKYKEIELVIPNPSLDPSSSRANVDSANKNIQKLKELFKRGSDSSAIK